MTGGQERHAVGVSIRRAAQEDVDFLVELASAEDVEPFLGATSARNSSAVAGEVERSTREPHDFGRFVIEVGGERAGSMGFELANRRSRIANLERLAVRSQFRGVGVADEAARLLQRHLVVDLGYHRLELEIYGFNVRARQHAERADFVREGTKRRAYWRHGEWTDGLAYALLADELDVPASILLLHDYLGVHNECVRTGEWEPLRSWFADDAELVFEGVPVGPFRGVGEIAAAYRDRPPDDQVITFRADVSPEGTVAADYGWLANPATVAGEMRLSARANRIARLIVSFAGA